ncbi:MAG: acyltransferase, partial [Candidatus Acidiferrales bacterium]
VVGNSPVAGVQPRTKSDHLPSLDGIRALSIILVLVGHLSGTRNFGNINLGFGDYAHLGVVVFFVISGFLITTLLLLEHAKKGRVSLKLFYARRSIRIFPAAYCYVACISLLALMGICHLEVRDFWHAVTYTVNFEPNSSWQIGHLWSLSVEEQFYLLWAFAFVALGPRRAGWVAAAVILLGPVSRSAAWLLLRGTPYRDLNMFPMVADSLATGCVLAAARAWLERRSWYLRLFHPGVSLSLVALILLINRYLGYTIVDIVGMSVINICIAILIHRSVYSSNDWAGRILNWKPIAFVGVLSYSLYVWQQPFLDRHSTAWVNAFPQNLIFGVIAALGSYLLLEKPLLKLRHRLRA